MRTLKFLSPERQQKIARETLEIYAPIAHRLGMGKIRGELEDLAFHYVDPVWLQQVKEPGRGTPQRRRSVPGRSAVGIIERKLKETNIQSARRCPHQAPVQHLAEGASGSRSPSTRCTTAGAAHHHPVGEVTVTPCWESSTTQWRPVPGRIKDFIAMPRPNLYQSLHTTVIAEDGHPFEVQIRTEEMHKMAEEGIAAHWKYKDGPVSARDEQRLAWLRQVVEWQREMAESRRVPLHAEDRSLSGRGLHLHAQGQGRRSAARRHADRLRLHRAYRGRNTCVGAKVNGRIVPLRYKLRSGDIVEIMTQAGHISQPRLAGIRQKLARAPENQALAQHSSARARH